MIDIKTDSRKVKKGDVFVALRGIVGDGHKFIPKAIENGASKIIAEEGNYDIDYEIVPDSRKYLNDYLKNKYNKYLDDMHIIGITGTNGKTTSAYILYDSLNKLGEKACYIGTIGYYLREKVCDLPNTTPDVTEIYDMLINAYEKGYRYAVIEASSEGLMHGRLNNIPFEFAIFTNLTQDHLNVHKTMENYSNCKKILFESLIKDGKAIINYDDQYKENFILSKNKNITYGFNGGDYKILNYNIKQEGSSFTYLYKNKEYKVNTKLFGKYNLYNIFVSVIILKELGIDDERINNVIKNVSAPPGRMDIVNYKSNLIIIDYAHTPDAISNIISTVKEICKGKIYTVFGCTGDRDRLKRPIMTKLVTDECDYAIITSDDLHNEDPLNIVNDMIKGLDNKNYKIEIDRKKAISLGINLLNKNDILLILGKGHEEVMIVKDNKKIPFNDKMEVLNYIKNRGGN